MDETQEIQSRPFAMLGSEQHIGILLMEITVSEKAYTAKANHLPGQLMLMMNQAEMDELRAKGFIFQIFRNPLCLL